ncbi:MAG TPA: hypothetical protein VK563_09670 [Puia sp.]|nr:hypothetical protein [Puia sp.]
MKTNILVSACCLILLGNSYRVRAEGTKEVMPDSTNGTGLIVSTIAAFPLGNVGSYVPIAGLTPADNRIYFHVKDYTTEKLYYGFHWEFLTPTLGAVVPYTDVYMNIYNPSGTLVTTIHLTGSGAGLINNAREAYAGPNIGGATPLGYNPLVFTPAMNGDYFVNFYRSTDGGVTHINNGESMISKYFDLTMAKTDNTQYKGRVHCNEWAFSVYNPAKGDIQDPLSPTNAQFFAYTTDSVVAKVYFPAKGFQPLAYIVAFNSFGVTNTGDWQKDRKSISLPHLVAPYLTGGYDVFLNQPDVTLYPVCIIPTAPTLVSPTIAGCPPGPYNVRFYAPQAGDYYIVLDLNGIPGYQPSSSDRYIELISEAPGIVTYIWDGKDGLGNPVPPNVSFPINFSFRKGRINIPFYDVELNINGFSVDAVAPLGAVNTTLYWDDSKLSSTSAVNDCGSNNNNYTGIGYQDTAVGQVSPGHAWNGYGNPSFSIPAAPINYGGTFNDQDNIQCNDFGNARLINSWAWGITLNTTQNVKLACINVSGTVWDDADNSANGTFSNIRTNGEPGTNAGNALYASLIDPVTNKVISTVPVNANGTYTLSSCPIDAIGMKVVISTVDSLPGHVAPAAAIPSNWVSTSPLIYTFNSGQSDVTGLDFGIEQLPDSYNQTYTILTPIWNSFRTLNGVGTVASPGPLKGSDPEDGVLGVNKTVVITTVPTNEELYYNGIQVTNNTKITNYNSSLLQVKFTNIAVTSLVFYYAYVDAAGKQDPTPAYYLINMSVVLQTNLVAFGGRATDQGNVLSWTATNETNGAYYIIERSSGGSDYEPIGRVDGDNSGNTVNHVFTDGKPFTDVASLYRLKLMDLSGGVSYSTTVSISVMADRSIVDVLPNPFRDVINVKVNLAKAGKISLRMLDNKGIVVRQMEYEASKGTNLFKIGSLSSLPVSVYFIQIVLPDQVFVKKVFNNK